MVTAAAYFTDHFLEAFSWMLIHSLWQGMLLAIVAALALMAGRGLSSAVRYRVVLVCFALFIAGAAGTFFWYWTSRDGVLVASVTGANAGSGWVRLDRSVLSGITVYFSRNAPVVVMVWFVIFAFRAVKMTRGAMELNRLRYSENQQVTDYWQEKMAELGSRLGLNRVVRLLESSLVKVPVVLGHFSPVILMPVGLLTGLPAGQLEGVLLHELAHIRRHDFLVNLVQAFTETVFFFNPGLLWISELLKQEREYCCDDLAVAQTGNRKEFVQALVSFKEYSLAASELSVGFSGQKNQLLERASRILGLKRSSVPTGAYVFVAISGFLLVCLLSATLTVAQISPSINKSKPIPVELTHLFKKESARERAGKTLEKVRIETTKKEAATQMRLADTAVNKDPVARIPDSLNSAAELNRMASEENAHHATLDRQRADQDRRQVMVDKALAEKEREQAEAKRLETIRNKSRPIPVIKNIIVPVNKQ
ncbi:M56 family metallopeptidase [Hufsiella ginkgonis]|uniref:Peptidase M56 domain-containing protein n=1 Tax=Hufsiella ginkgonis TaxID=2695274 RepID=A0A7K1XXT1_9SPHI|nr:M56 family metallopeptidase [Hufsiella ginkgonis]MXV15814.1 hypothetical protein [Hufsiella ginkgonis]